MIAKQVVQHAFKKIHCLWGVNFLCMASLLTSILWAWRKPEARSGKLVGAWSFSLANSAFKKPSAGILPLHFVNLVALANAFRTISDRAIDDGSS